MANSVTAFFPAGRGNAGLVNNANGTRLVTNAVGGVIGAEGAAFVANGENTSVIASYSTAEISSGDVRAPITFTDSYVLDYSDGTTAAEGMAVELAALNGMMFANWDQYSDAAGTRYWLFGDSEALPYLSDKLTFTDIDNDQVLDADDASHQNAPLLPIATQLEHPMSGTPRCDIDCQSTSGLILDAFPDQPAASVDAD